MKSYTLKVANDLGSGEQKLIINGELIIQPNIYSNVRYPPRLFDFVSINENFNDNLVVRIDSSALDVDIYERCYFIGKQALKGGNPYYNTHILDPKSIVDSKISIINTVGHIAAYVANQCSRDNKDNVRIKAYVDMITALPGNQYEEAEKFSSKFLNGVHIVEVISSHKNSIYVEINFSNVKTMLKGASIMYYLQNLKSEDKLFKELVETVGSKVDKNFFENNRILHCIIGEGTTDYSISSKDDFTNIYSLQSGIGHATERILYDFRRSNYLPTKFTRQDIYLAIDDVNNKFHSKVTNALKPEIEWEFHSIFSVLERVVAERKKYIDFIMVYGGGSILTKDYFKYGLSKIEKVTGIKSLIINEENVVTIEVKGMYSLL